MDYLKILHENPDLAEEFDSLFGFFLMDELSPRDDAEGRCTFSMPGIDVYKRQAQRGMERLIEEIRLRVQGLPHREDGFRPLMVGTI